MNKIFSRINNQRGASMVEYALALALVLGVFLVANQILLSTIDQRSQIVDQSFQTMVGCIGAGYGGQLKALGGESCS